MKNRVVPGSIGHESHESMFSNVANPTLACPRNKQVDLWFTPLKINMEPTNHPIEKENHLPNLHFGVQNVNFPGV